MEEVLDLFIQECKDKNYDKYEIREKLKKYLKEITGTNLDFRICVNKKILNYVYKELIK